MDGFGSHYIPRDSIHPSFASVVGFIELCPGVPHNLVQDAKYHGFSKSSKSSIFECAYKHCD